MNSKDKSKEELIKELQELQQENIALKLAGKKSLTGSLSAEKAVRHAEMNLQVGEAQKNAILNGISSNIAFVDKDLKIIWANKTAAESVNKTPDEMVGHTCHWFWANPSKPCEDCPSLKAFISKKSEQTIMQTPDGKFWEERGEPIFDTQGNLIGVVEIATDITERKRLEIEKRKTDTMFRTLSKAIEQSPVTTVITDVAGNIEFVNPKFTETTGYTAQEAIGKNPRILKTGDKQASEYKELWDTILSGKNWHGVFKNKKKNGEIYWESAVISPVKNEEGTITHFLAVKEDITERKKAEEFLKISEDKFRNLVTNMSVGVLLQGPNAEMTLCNPNALQLLGITEDQLMGKTSFDPDWNVIHEDGSPFPGNTHPVPQAIATRVPVRNVIMGVYRPSLGNRAWLLVDAVPQLNEDGSVSQVICSFIDISKRKQAEELLQKSQVNLNNAQQIAHLGSWEWDMKTNTINFSDELFRIFGLNPETSIINVDSLLKYIHPDDKKFYLSNLENSSLKGVSAPFEYRIVRPDGKVRNLHASGKVIFDNNQKPIKGTGVVQDITERKQVEAALKNSEEKYRMIAENTSDGILIIAADTQIQYVSPSYLKQLGYSETEELRRNAETIFSIVHPDDRDTVFAYIYKAIELKKSYLSYQYRVMHKAGHYIWREDNANFKYDSNRNLINTYVICRDITDRKQAEEELLKTNAYLENLINYANAPIIVWDSQFRITRFNHAFENLTGYTEAEVLGKSLEILFQPALAQNAMSLINKTLTGERWEAVEIIIHHRNQTNRTVLWNSATLFAPDGKTPLATIAQGQDITERKKAEQEIKLKNRELRQLNATKDKFFSIIAHDLKSPFNAIMGFSELLMEQIKEKDYNGVEEYAEIILKSSGHALDLLMNLMDWARSQTGKLDFIPEHFEMVDFIKDITLLFDDIASQKAIAIKKELPHNATVFADKAMISTVLRNLISNAIKFTKPGGEIIITVAEKGTEIIVSVIDNGVGIPEKMIDKLFRIDENYTTSGTNNERGTGLGLILCKEFIEKHAGNIWVESEEGKGSVFSFTLPGLTTLAGFKDL